jgi:hypothetical protein
MPLDPLLAIVLPLAVAWLLAVILTVFCVRR